MVRAHFERVQQLRGNLPRSARQGDLHLSPRRLPGGCLRELQACPGDGGGLDRRALPEQHEHPVPVAGRIRLRDQGGDWTSSWTTSAPSPTARTGSSTSGSSTIPGTPRSSRRWRAANPATAVNLFGDGTDQNPAHRPLPGPGEFQQRDVGQRDHRVLPPGGGLRDPRRAHPLLGRRRDPRGGPAGQRRSRARRRKPAGSGSWACPAPTAS